MKGKGRRREGPSREQLIAGVQPVAAVLRSAPDSIRWVWVARDSRNQRVQDLALLARDAGIELREEARETLDHLSGIDHHQDIVAQLYEKAELGEHELKEMLAGHHGAPLLLVLDGVQDPHNLGACLRTAEAAGCDAVVIPKDRAAGLSPVVHKASAGASEIVPLYRVTNLARCLRTIKDAGLWLVGTTDQAEQSLYDADLGGPVALVMGGEGKGLRRLTAEHCDFLVRIPMAGQIESLNVSVAAGVCLFEIQRRRR